jgi:hypothetical protein
MRSTLQRLALLIVLLAGSLLGAAAPAQATSSQIDGTADFLSSPGGACPQPLPEGFEYPYVLVLQGSLSGCWYTHVETTKLTPSGTYLETGQEYFVGRLNGGPPGTFTTTYRFEAKLAPDGSEVRGRCQHPLVAGSGTGGFTGATGRVDFKDIIEDPITYVYRGHISVP